MKTISIHISTLLIAIFTSLLCVNIHAQTTSNFSTGATFTEHTFKPSQSDPNTVNRGKDLLLNSTKIVNQHVMGFGAGNPEPSPGNYEFTTIKRRIGNNTGLGNQAETVVLTACCAPTWMRDTEYITPGPTDWLPVEWFETAPSPDNFGNYADLVAEIVSDPELSNIEYVQVWNEMKGFWHPTEDRWNYEAYIDLYNQVWDAIKAVDEDESIKIGGPYVVVGVYGNRQTAQWKCNDRNMELVGDDSWGYFDCRDLEVIEEWLQQKNGADFIVVDGNIINKDDVYNSGIDEFDRTERFRAFMEWLRGLNNTDAQTLPVWWGEWYAESDEYVAKKRQRQAQGIPIFPLPFDEQDQIKQNALMATALIRMIKSGASTALLWGPQGDLWGNSFPLALFTDTEISGGGQATRFHTTQKYLYDHFSAGTTLINATTDSPNIEVLASNDKTLLVNMSNSYQTLTFRGLTHSLQGYEVKLIDTPQIGGGTCNVLNNGRFSNGTNDWYTWSCDMNIVSGACQISNIEQAENPWNVALAQGDFTLEYGKQYEIRFDAASIQNSRTINVKAGLNGEPYTGYVYREISLTPVNQYFTIPFTMWEPTTSRARLEFHIGTNTTGLIVDNVRLISLSDNCDDNDCERAQNGDFADGLTGWSQQRCTATPTGNSVDISIPSAYPQFWDVALKQQGLNYQQGKEYRVSFQAKADANRFIQVKAGMGRWPYTEYHLQEIPLTTTLRNYAFTFTMNYATDNNAFLEFFFGDSATDLFLGNISVTETDCAVGFRQNLFNETITDYEVFPNPTNNNLNVSLDVTDGYDTGIIRLFDLNGRIILEEEKALSNINQFQLNIQAIPAGVYMLRVDVGGYFLTHKVVKY